MPENQSGLWEAIRRALGRLVASAQVRELPPSRLGSDLNVRGEDCLTLPDAGVGPQEATWSPQARSASVPPPCADAGGGGADLASVAAVVGLDAAFSPGAITVHRTPPLAPDAAVHRQSLLSFPPLSPRVWDLPVLFAAGAVRGAAVCPPFPAVGRLPTEAPRLSGRATPAALNFGRLGVRVGMSVCAEVPLVRARRPAPAGLRVAQAFAAERRQLAGAAQVDLDDVALLGVYPLVPVAAVRRLALEGEGQALALWLKPEALAAAATGRSPRLATLIVGRQRSTGRMIQSVA